MDYQIQRSVATTINFNEVVAATQGADAAASPVQINQISTPKCRKVNLCIQRVRSIAHFTPTGDILPNDLIQLSKVNLRLLEASGFQATSNIDSNHAGDDFVRDRHCSTNSAALTSMNIRHDADFRICKFLPVADGLNLFSSSSFYRFTKTLCTVVKSSYFNHFQSPYIGILHLIQRLVHLDICYESQR